MNPFSGYSFGGPGRPVFDRLAATVTGDPLNAALHLLGRCGQMLGLGIPAVAILLELNHAITLGQMLMLLVASVCCFWIGRILEGYSRT